MGLFREENYKIIIEPEIKLIPEFKRLIMRDKDRQKRNALTELAYVYFKTDYRSPYYIYPPEEREARIKKDLQLPEDFKEDLPIKRACIRYEEMQQTPAIQSLKSLRESLYVSLSAIDYMKNYLNSLMVNSGNIDDNENVEVDPTELIKQVNELLKLSNNIPSAIATLEQVEEKVKKEQSDKRRIKGGGKANYFED